MKKFVCVLLFVLFFTSAAISAHAEKPEFNLTLGNGILRGDTTYRIGGISTSASGYTYDIPFPYKRAEIST